ncbi:hypothetical protein FRC03_005321 [Tulasnella sp. 419]|nr:hypothetical protein FRC03_005321 [Tulasnella sp. 419]
MSAGLQVIGVYLDRFATFIKEVAKPSSKIDEALIASNLVLGQNVRALQDHLISKNVDLDPSDRQVIEDTLRLCDLLRSPGYTIPSRRLQQKMDMSHEAVEGLGVKYKVPMDWSPYTRPQSSGTSTSSFSKPSVTQVSDATSSLKVRS